MQVKSTNVTIYVNTCPCIFFMWLRSVLFLDSVFPQIQQVRDVAGGLAACEVQPSTDPSAGAERNKITDNVG